LSFCEDADERDQLASPLARVYPYLKQAIVPLLGLNSRLPFPARPAGRDYLYLYLLFSSVGDVFLMNCTFRVYAIGGVFFLFANLTRSAHFAIDWQRLPLPAVVLVAAMIAVPGRFLLPHFRTGGFHADSFAIYTTAIEIDACSAVAPIQVRPFRNRSFIVGAIGYFLFVLSDTLPLRIELQKPRTQRYRSK
jgi:uncharacterized membrane protein YhhN